MKKFIRTAVDLGKNYFQFHGLAGEGGAPVSRKLKRSKVLEFYAQIEPCRVGMEACGSAHHWARELIAMGHEVVLIPPAYIKPYVKRGKNDAVDAAAICEAMARPDMRFVPVKSADDQAVLMLHKSRELLIKQRTMSVNALRGHLAEFGLVVAKGIGRVDELLALAQADARLPQIAKATVTELAEHLEGLDQSIDAIDDDIARAHRKNPKSCLIDQVPGIGALIASVVAASAPDPGVFKSGRDFAAWLGLTPGDIPVAARRNSAPLPSRATATYARCSSSVQPRYCAWLASAKALSPTGSTRCGPESPNGWRPWHWPTSWPGSAGRS